MTEHNSRLVRSVTIASPVDAVYTFHLDTRNAARISPPRTRFVKIEGEFPLRQGGVVELWVRQSPLPLTARWRIVVAELERNRTVVDEAVRSPFAYWRHEHRFEPIDESHTLIIDDLTYRLPFGIMGRLADRLMVRRVLQRMFAERHRRSAQVIPDTESAHVRSG